MTAFLKRAVSGLTALCLCAALCTGCAGTTTPGTAEIDYIVHGTAENDVSRTEYRRMAENAELALYVNPDTTAFRVEVKEDGYVWSSSDEEEPELFSLSFQAADGTLRSFSAYADAVKNGQYRIRTIENGVCVTYSLGNVRRKLYNPPVVAAARYEELLGRSNAAGQRLLKTLYYAVDWDTLTAAKRADLSGRYPGAVGHAVYLLRNTSLPSTQQQALHDALVAAGYTEEQYSEDLVLSGGETRDTEPKINVSLYLTLDGASLQAEVPLSEMQYDRSLMIPDTLELLTNFGRPKEGETGYFLLPDGSGSLMEFYNGKDGLNDYRVPIYGEDLTVGQSEITRDEVPAVFPVFGCVRGDHAFFTELSEGEALAYVHAMPGGSRQRPAVFAEYGIHRKTQVETITNASANTAPEYYALYQDTAYAGSIRQSYSFLSGEEAGYVGMARLYRQRLFGDREASAAAERPLFLNVIGAVETRHNVLGISYTTQTALSTCAGIEAMCGALREEGISPVLRLKGLWNGGVHQQLLRRLKAERGVGTEQELETLYRTLSAQGIAVYPDTELQLVYAGGMGSGLSRRTDAAWLLEKSPAKLYPFDPALFRQDTDKRPYYAVNMTAVGRQAAAVQALWKDRGWGRLSVGSIGSALYGDYHPGATEDRQTVLNRQKELLRELGEQIPGLMLSGGTAALLPYAESVLELPLSSAGYDITDRSVPFTAMVLSGYVNYTGPDLSVSCTGDRDWLILLETGAAPYYTVCTEDTEVLMNSEFSDWYAIEYAAARERITETCRRLSAVGRDLFGRRITDHFELQPQVNCTVFEDGSAVIVNYSGAEVLYAGQTVAAHSAVRCMADAVTGGDAS